MEDIVRCLNMILPSLTMGYVLGSVITREILRIRFEKAVKNGDIILKETKESEGA